MARTGRPRQFVRLRIEDLVTEYATLRACSAYWSVRDPESGSYYAGKGAALEELLAAEEIDPEEHPDYRAAYTAACRALEEGAEQPVR